MCMMNVTNSIGVSSITRLSIFHSSLKSYIDTRHPESPLILFRQLLQSHLKPNDLTFSLLCKTSSTYLFSASNPVCLRLEADQIQTHLVKSSLDHFVYVKTALLDLYMKLGCLEISRKLFDEMPDRDVVAWNALICGYSRNGFDCHALEVFVEMLKDGFIPCSTTLVGLVPSCGHRGLLSQGKSIHGIAVKADLDCQSQVKNALMSMYSKCADLEGAELLFGEMEEKCVVSWNTMIGSYGQNCLYDKALLVFKQMQEMRIEANSVTIVSLLSANASPDRMLSFITKTGIVNYTSVTTSLVCSYAKYGDIQSALLVYRSKPQHDLVCLTAIISSYAEIGNMELVLEYFAQMRQIDLKPDAVTIISIIHGITTPAQIVIGSAFHGYVLKTGLNTHSLVSNGLITMYSKIHNLEAIFVLFYEMDEKPLISWNSVISGCIQAGKASDAFKTFYQMKLSGPSPDVVTIASLLSGCSQLGYLQFGKELHNFVLRNNLESEMFVLTALIDMYAKCGTVDKAEIIFNNIKGPCLATWNAMMTAYSLCGLELKALAFYDKLQEQGLKPDRITFLGVLAACTHAGFVTEGRKYFQIMTEESGIVPNLQHCACMVGLLGRAGLFDEALLFIMNMEIEPDCAVWGALLSGCCIHKEIELGEYLAKKMYLLDYRNGGLYVLMSNLYAAKGMWDDVERVRRLMKDTGGDRYSGISLIK